MTGEQPSPGTEFLIAEYQEISREFTRMRHEGLKRLNFFITLTSAVGAALILLSEASSLSSTDLQFVALGALAFLIIFGWYTFAYTVSRDITTDKNVRAAARIRRYFADQHPIITPHLTWQNHDEPSSWVERNNPSNLRHTAQTILALLCGLLIGIIVNLLSSSLLLATIVGVLSAVLIWVILLTYTNRQLKQAREAAIRNVRFPRPK